MRHLEFQRMTIKAGILRKRNICFNQLLPELLMHRLNRRLKSQES